MCVFRRQIWRLVLRCRDYATEALLQIPLSRIHRSISVAPEQILLYICPRIYRFPISIVVSQDPDENAESRIGELETFLALTSNRIMLRRNYPDDGGDTFLLNAGSYQSHTASHPRGQYSSKIFVFRKMTSCN
jgi:hypothetical protein